MLLLVEVNLSARFTTGEVLGPFGSIAGLGFYSDHLGRGV